MYARRIVLFTANRAEQGLVYPIHAQLSLKVETVEAHVASMESMEPATVKSGWGFADYAVTEYKWPDLALVPCDRPEMVGVALYLFYHNVPFAHLHAGDIGSGTHDEIGRWIISRCANLHFCNSPDSAQNLLKSGEEAWRVHLVGSTAFDDVEIDDRLCPTEPFSLILLHPSFSEEATLKDLEEVKFHTPLRPFASPVNYVILGPNNDDHHELIEKAWDLSVQNHPDNIRYYPRGVPRSQFLGLMKNCAEFITNSSSALYELPYFDIRKYVPIGERNRERKFLVNIETGAAQRIAKILATVQIDERLLRKKFVL